MPVTIQVAPHQAKVINIDGMGLTLPEDADPSWLPGRFLRNLRVKGRSSYRQSRIVEELRLSNLNHETATRTIPRQNGFVFACLEAYGRRRHLVLRPDDVWTAIITQFSFYARKHVADMWP